MPIVHDVDVHPTSLVFGPEKCWFVFIAYLTLIYIRGGDVVVGCSLCEAFDVLAEREDYAVLSIAILESSDGSLPKG